MKNIEKALGKNIKYESKMYEHYKKFYNMIENNADYLYKKNGEKKQTLALASTIIKEYAKMCLIDYNVSVNRKCLGETSEDVLVYMEECGGKSRADWLNRKHVELIEPVIKEIVELTLALGNTVLKPKYKNGKLGLDYTTHSEFVPIRWENGMLSEVVFKSNVEKDKKIYTLLEHMNYEDNVFSVRYYSFEKSSDKVYSEELGYPVPLTDVSEWADLRDFSIHAKLPWFVHIRTKILNNVDLNSGLGVSVLVNSADTIKAADETFNSLLWEMQAGKVRTMLPKTMFTRDSSKKIIAPDPEDTYYMLTESGPIDSGTPYQFSPALRNAEFIETLKFYLRMIEMQIAFSEGTLSVDEKSGFATATQVVTDKAETIATIMDMNKHMLAPAVTRILDVFSDMADSLNIKDSGEGDYEVSVETNTSAAINHTERFNQAMELYKNGLVPDYYPILYSSLQVTDGEAKALAEKGRRRLSE